MMQTMQTLETRTAWQRMSPPVVGQQEIDAYAASLLRATSKLLDLPSSPSTDAAILVSMSQHPGR